MSTWNLISLAVIGDKKDVSAFHRVALHLPFLSHYVIERNGKPVRYAMFEDMIFEKPWLWCKHWWRSCYHFTIRDVEPAVEMVQDVSDGRRIASPPQIAIEKEGMGHGLRENRTEQVVTTPPTVYLLADVVGSISVDMARSSQSSGE
jgi:hypothetical protein